MKFCMVTTFYPPYHFGGDAIYVQRLAAELGRLGHQVDVVHDLDAYYVLHRSEPAASFQPSANVTVHRLKSPLGLISPLATHQTGWPLFKPQLRRLLTSGGFDVIHFHNASLVGPGAFGFGRAVKLYTMHEQWLVCPMHLLWKFGRQICDTRRCTLCCLLGRRPPQLWRATGLLRRRAQAIDRFLAPSLFARDKHRELGMDLPTTVLPPFLPDAAPLPSREAAPHPRPYFLFVGRLVRTKGLQTVLGAFRGVQSVDLLVVGEGDQAHALRTAATDMANVRFLGFQPYEHLRRLYRDAVALIVPSISYEIFPMVMLEAFAEGTPVIARDLPGMAEIVRDADAGLLFRDDAGLRSALDRMQTDAALRRKLGENGRRAFLEQWTAGKHIRRYLEIVEACAAERRGGRGETA
jgi:glycosyltransferase involved in cell wall biosynthesis